MPVEPQLPGTGPPFRELKLRTKAVVHWSAKSHRNGGKCSFLAPNKVSYFLTFASSPLPPLPFSLGWGIGLCGV